MYLREIKNIKNYRNSNDISLRFSPKITYIVGENNLGKTNVFDLLKNIFNTKDFDPTDFLDEINPITVNCFFSLDSDTLVFFKDAGFDPKEPILVEQNFDERSSYSCNNFPVYSELRRKICFISVPSDIKDEKIPTLMPSSKYSPIQYIYKKS